MSHEGIRFLDETQLAEEARRAERAARVLPRGATEPVKVRVDKTAGAGMEIDWKDGHHSAWTFGWLRLGCPCATCHEERDADGREPGVAKPAPANLLPMYKAPPRPTAVVPTGNYAIRFDWNDGHTSGIYSWDYLRRHCQCAECLAIANGSRR